MSTTTGAGNSSLHPRLSFRDWLGLALFFIVPTYARFCVLPLISSVLGHIYVIGTTGICIVHFSGGIVSLGEVGNVVRGLAIATLPGLSKSYTWTAWILPDVGGWHGAMIRWAFLATSLAFLLPKNYGSDIEVTSLRPSHIIS
jgi:hypothetical protein